MSLHKGAKLIKVTGTPEQVFERMHKFVREHDVAIPVTFRDIDNILSHAEGYVEYEVESDVHYYSKGEGTAASTYVQPELRIIY